jgi:tetratricopeptide (TPR) repeat protein
MQNWKRLSYAAGALTLLALLGCGSAQSRKAGYLTHGQAYYADGNFDKAAVEFRNAAEIDEKDASVRYWLGRARERSGDIRGAMAQYQSAVNNDPTAAPARAALARLYLYAGLADRAMEIIEPGLANAPEDPQLLTVHGAAEERLGNPSAALIDAQTAVQLAPDDDYAVALLASLYKKRAQFDDAIKTVQAGLLHLPRSVDLHSIMADLYLAAQRPAEAEAELRQVVALEPKALVHRYRLAQYYLGQQNVDAAEHTLQEAITAVPDSSAAKLTLVQFLSAQRGRERAGAEADQLMAQNPDNDDLKLVLGEFMAQSGLSDRAESVFRGVIAHSDAKPNGLIARDRLAALFLSRGDVAGATALVDAVLKQNASDNDALMLRGDMALLRGNPAAAILDLRAVLRDQPDAVPIMRALARAYADNGEGGLAESTLRNAVQVAPKDPDSRLQLAQTLLAANKLAEARPMLEQLAKDSPLNVAVQAALFRVQAAQKNYIEARSTALDIQKSRPDLGLGFYLAGIVDEADGKAADAEHDYQQALKLQADAGEPLEALMRLYVRLRQPDKAMQRIDSVIAASPGNANARLLKAELLASQGRFDDAIDAYQGSVRAAPKWVQAWHGLALAQVAATRPDDAVKTLQLGIEQTQGSSVLIGDLGALYERLKRPDDAIALYEGVLARNPQSPVAMNNLAILLVNYKTDADSLARAQKLADQLASSSLVQVIDTRGWVKYKSGDFYGAEALLQRAVDQLPDSPELRYHLGMAQLRSGETEPAEQNLETALRSSKPFNGMEQARTELERLRKVASAG